MNKLNRLERIAKGVSKAILAGGMYLASHLPYSENAAYAQVETPTIDWMYPHENPTEDDNFVSFAKTEGGFVSIGEAEVGSNQIAIKFLKTNSEGGPFLENIITRPGDLYPEKVVAKPDGYIVAGSRDMNSEWDGFILKVDTDLNFLWENYFGDYSASNDDDFINDFKPTADGGFILAGRAESYLLAIKTDSLGSTAWPNGWQARHSLNLYVFVDPTSITQTCDGGYALTGEVLNPDYVNYDTFVIRLDEDGGIYPQRKFFSDESGISIVEAPNGDLVTISEFGVAFGRFRRWDSNLDNVLAEKLYISELQDLDNLIPTIDGGFAMARNTQSLKEGITKINSVGEIQWHTSIPTPQDYVFTLVDDFLQLPNEDYVIGGRVNSGPSESDFYLAKTTLNGPPLHPPLELDNPITVAPGVENLVLVTHGWKGIGEGGWPEDMANAIEANIHPEHNASEWEVTYYDWRKDASTLSPGVALVNAKERGMKMGMEISSLDLKILQLFGHSIGSRLNEEAARVVMELSPNTEIHITDADSYRPPFTDPVNTYRVAWRDHYFRVDPLIFTQEIIPQAFNLDLIDINPSAPSSHSYPHEWYLATILDPLGTPGANLYGSVRSLAIGGQANWLASQLLPKDLEPVQLEKILLGDHTLFDNIDAQSFLGTVTQSPGGIKLITGSPVSIESGVNIPPQTDYMEFSYRFEGPDKGYLSAYLNDELVFTADERIHGSELQSSGPIIITEQIEPTNIVGFLLNNINPGENSTAFVSDIKFGELSEGMLAAKHSMLYR